MSGVTTTGGSLYVIIFPHRIGWDECGKFLQENVGLAVDERRHSQMTHIAGAILVRDLQQVAARCHSYPFRVMAKPAIQIIKIPASLM